MSNGPSKHRLRAVADDGGADVRVLLRHPMETGTRRHADTGELIPRHYIQELHAELNGMEVMRAYWSWGMAFNPYLAFRIRRAQSGDAVRVYWIDNLGVADAVEGIVD